VSQKVNFLGQGNKGGSSRLPLGEKLANVLLLACCYQEVSVRHPAEPVQVSIVDEVLSLKRSWESKKEAAIQELLTKR
jgi:hypothetical protein